MEIIIPEVELTAPSINSQDFLVFRVRVSPNDWDNDVKQAVYDAARNGTPLSCVMVGFQDDKVVDPLPKKRAHLAHVMKLYCEQQGLNEDQHTKSLYKKYKIQSRTELTETQLDKEIESHKA